METSAVRSVSQREQGRAVKGEGPSKNILKGPQESGKRNKKGAV